MTHDNPAYVLPAEAGRRFAREFVGAIPPRDQRQDDLLTQLEDLVMVATRLGMYDAADWIKVYMGVERNQANAR